MTVKYAECRMTFLSTLDAKPIRRRMAKVDMNVFSGMAVGPQPIKLVIKGEHFQHVIELMTLFRQPDEEIVKAVRGSILAPDVADKTDEEAVEWVRGNILSELQEMAKGE